MSRNTIDNPPDRKSMSVESCEQAWNKDPVFGVIGIQSGPRS